MDSEADVFYRELPKVVSPKRRVAQTFKHDEMWKVQAFVLAAR